MTTQHHSAIWKRLLLLIAVAGIAYVSITLWSGGSFSFGLEDVCLLLTGVIVGALGAIIGTAVFNKLRKIVNPTTRLGTISVRVVAALAAGILASAAGFLIGFPIYGPVFWLYSTVAYRILRIPFGGDTVFWLLWLYTIVCIGASGIVFGVGIWQPARPSAEGEIG